MTALTVMTKLRNMFQAAGSITAAVP
jgi:hypothetical protein